MTPNKNHEFKITTKVIFGTADGRPVLVCKISFLVFSRLLNQVMQFGAGALARTMAGAREMTLQSQFELSFDFQWITLWGRIWAMFTYLHNWNLLFRFTLQPYWPDSWFVLIQGWYHLTRLVKIGKKSKYLQKWTKYESNRNNELFQNFKISNFNFEISQMNVSVGEWRPV